jgi:hypothetical protein
MRASCRQAARCWFAIHRFVAAASGPTLELCESLSTPAARAKTWSGLHALGWLEADGGAAGVLLRSSVARLRTRMEPEGAGLAGYRERLGQQPLHAWDAALAGHVETARLRPAGGAT